MCVLFDDTPLYYYVINSDGTGLEQMQISAFPTVPSPRAGSFSLPPGVSITSPSQISPDGSLLTYVSQGGLYVVGSEGGETSLLFQPEEISGLVSGVGPACWSPDGAAIRFIVWSRKGNESQPPELFTIDRNGRNLQRLFTLVGLEDVGFGDCSPDGRELAISIPESPIEGKAGLYVINLDDGEWRQILTDYYVWEVRSAPPESLP